MINLANDNKNKIWIFDNVFSKHELESFKNLYCVGATSLESLWYTNNEYQERFYSLNNQLKQINFSLDFEGVEVWTQYNYRKQRHRDVDVKKFIITGKESHPLLSAVIFLETDNDHEGFLMFDSGFSVRPKINRLVLFTPGTYHEVSTFLQKRVTLLINFWDYKLDLDKNFSAEQLLKIKKDEKAGLHDTI